jgi:hypothetical protein
MYVTKDVIKKPFITKGFNINALQYVLAEREGFEPSIRYKRIHTFQACSLSHSDTSPESIAILSAKHRFIRMKIMLIGCAGKKGSGLSV